MDEPAALTATERAIAVAIARASFPAAGTLALEGAPERVAAWLDAYASRLPPAERTQLRGLLHAVDRGYGLWTRSGGRLVDAPDQAVSDYLRSWVEAPTYAQRMLFEGLRTVLIMGLCGDPAARTAMGMP
jgi:hypothetical protein